jgi:GntR family transcriptional repressor for pyruvate dehydrogenase complex
VAQHQDILDALTAHDPGRAESAALVHVATTEAWFRLALGERRQSPVTNSEPPAARVAVRGRGRG